jgi:hypothetical protein
MRGGAAGSPARAQLHGATRQKPRSSSRRPEQRSEVADWPEVRQLVGAPARHAACAGRLEAGPALLDVASGAGGELAHVVLALADHRRDLWIAVVEHVVQQQYRAPSPGRGVGSAIFGIASRTVRSLAPLVAEGHAGRQGGRQTAPRQNLRDADARSAEAIAHHEKSSAAAATTSSWGTSRRCCERFQRCPNGSSSWPWRSPQNMSANGWRALAPAAIA